MVYRAFVACTILAATLAWAQSEMPALTPSLTPSPDPMRRSQSMSPGSDGSPGAISGSVRTVSDNPVQDAVIEIRDSQGSLVGQVYSNPGGGFAVTNLHPGGYTVTARLGLAEVHERVEVAGMQAFVTLRMPNVSDSVPGGSSASVSVAEMKVPDKARKEFSKGQEFFSRGDIDEARKHAERALKIYPGYAAALTLRGILDLQEHKNEDARVDLEKAIEVDPNYGMGFIALGSDYNMLDRYDDAMRVLNRGISLSPNSWQGYFERARTFLGKQLFANALNDLNKTAQFIVRDFPQVHLLRANALSGLHNYEGAEHELQSYLDQAPRARTRPRRGARSADFSRSQPALPTRPRNSGALREIGD